VVLLAYPIEGRGGSGVWEEVFGVANFGGCLKTRYFAASLFQFSSDFGHFWSISAIFESHFSLFHRFCSFQTRYTSADTLRTMIRSVEIRFACFTVEAF
jgi:hypothetical protein